MTIATKADSPIYAKAAASLADTGRRPWIDTADVAKLIRAGLADKWPGVRFYVRLDRYAGGSSIDVSYDGAVVNDKGWPMLVLVDYDGNVLDPTPVDPGDVDYALGGRYAHLAKPGAPAKRDVDAFLSPFNGKGFDGSIDLAYYNDSWLNPDGTVTFAGTDGTAGSRGYVAPMAASRTHPSALLVSMGSSYVRADDTLPYDVRSK